MRRTVARASLALGLLLSLYCVALSSPAGASPARDEGLVHTLRIRTSVTGMHRLTYDDLTAAGVPLGADTSTFAMIYEGSPVDIQITGSGGPLTSDDSVVFFASSYCSRYTRDNVYFLTYGGPPSSARIIERPVAVETGQPVRDWAYQTVHVESDEQYFSDYPLGPADDHIFDSPTLLVNASVLLAGNSYELSLPHRLTAGQVRFRAQFYGGLAQEAVPDQSVRVKLNSHELGSFTWDGRAGFRAAATAPANFLDGAPDILRVEASLDQLPSLSQYWVYVDWLELDYPAALVAEADRLYAPDLGLDGDTGVQVIASGFTTDQVTVYDVRDQRRPVMLTGAAFIPKDAGYEVQFRDAWDPAAPAPAYFLTTPAGLITPLVVEPADAPAWNTPDNTYDYIAIVHPSLWEAVQPLLDKRAANGLRVAKVDPQHIYDLYSAGRPDPEAIRRFFGYAYGNWKGEGPRPRYALLVGDGHYDFKNAFKTPLENLVPPYLLHVDAWIGETAADNRYVSVDGPDDYLPDMAIGRIPAQSAQELTYAVDKILAYEDSGQAPGGAWQNRVSFVADEADNYAGNFHELSEDARLNWLPPTYDSRHVYWETDYTTTGAMKVGIKSTFADSIMVQWFGHGSKFRWGSVSGIFNLFDVPDLPVAAQWPVTIDYSCWTGYFININGVSYNGVVDYHSLAEKLLLTQWRGSVASIAPSGQHVGDALQLLNQGIIKAVFQDEVQSIGDALNAAKAYYYANAVSWPDVIDTTALFGDPAMKVRLLAPPAAPVVTIERSAKPDAVELAWLQLEPNFSYEIWRAESPYFEPGPESRQIAAVDAASYAPGNTVTFTDDGSAPPPVVVVGDPAHNYCWLTRGANPRGNSTNSNRVGVFNFALAPGAP
jgi:hypothetical protein